MLVTLIGGPYLPVLGTEMSHGVGCLLFRMCYELYIKYLLVGAYKSFDLHTRNDGQQIVCVCLLYPGNHVLLFIDQLNHWNIFFNWNDLLLSNATCTNIKNVFGRFFRILNLARENLSLKLLWNIYFPMKLQFYYSERCISVLCIWSFYLPPRLWFIDQIITLDQKKNFLRGKIDDLIKFHFICILRGDKQYRPIVFIFNKRYMYR